MSDEPLRVACVGIGRWSDVLARAIQRSDKLALVSCFTRSPEKRAAFAQRYGCRQAATYDELLADDRVEAVLVTTPNPAHAEAIERAAAAGKHVWVEKPLAHNLEHARRIGEAVRAHGVTLAVGHSARMLGASRKMKQLVEQGDVGAVVLVEGNYSNERALELTPDKWRYYSANSPGGPLIQLVVHHFDTVQHILGPIAEVQAYKRRLYTRSEVDDVAVVIALFERGYLGYFGGSWVSPGAYSIRLYGTEANLYHELDFAYWTALDVDRHCTLVRESRGSGERAQIEIPATDMFREELEDFADSVRARRRPEIGFEEGMRALAVVEAAILSAEGGRPVGIAEVLG